MDRAKFALLAAKAAAYDQIQPYQPYYNYEGKWLVEIRNPSKFAVRTAVVDRLQRRYENERTETER